MLSRTFSSFGKAGGGAAAACARQGVASETSAASPVTANSRRDSNRVIIGGKFNTIRGGAGAAGRARERTASESQNGGRIIASGWNKICLLYTSPSPRDRQKSRM